VRAGRKLGVAKPERRKPDIWDRICQPGAHVWQGGKCVHCQIPRQQFERLMHDPDRNE